MSECFDERFSLLKDGRSTKNNDTEPNRVISHSSGSISSLGVSRTSRGPSQQGHGSSHSLTANTPKSSRIGRGSVTVQQMTVNRLHFQEEMLYGREQEIKQLEGAFKKSKSRPSRELFLLSGAAGTGKSALALQLRNTVRTAAGFYMAGKFDVQQRDEPFAGIASACRGLCQDILAHEDGSSKSNWLFYYEELKRRLDEALGTDTMVLTMVIPNLLQIMGGERVDENPSGTGYLEAKHRFNFAFRRFIRVICSFGPVVLTLDDLQWADLASFDLIETLLTDEENEGSLIIVGSYRSDEVNDAHPLAKMVRDLEALNEKSLRIYKISIGVLAVSHVNEMLSDLMASSQQKTADLAECVHKKTLGNVFFIIQYLRSLVDKELLRYNTDVKNWTWNVADINANTMATDNVVDLMREKLNSLPSGICEIIPMIACLGSIFGFRLFHLVVTQFKEELLNIKNVKETSAPYTPEEFINVCEGEGLIINCGHEMFKWEHHKIQEAALSLVDKDDLASVQFQVGELLQTRLSPEEVNDNLFVVVNLLNQGPISHKTDPTKRIEIAKLNLRAGRNALASSAFAAATSYFGKGMELLPEDKWIVEYDLSIELYSTAAEAQFCVGNFEVVKLYCDEVIAQGKSPFLDKRRAYNKLLHSIAAQGRLQEAQDLCVVVLAKLGCRFPKYGMTLYTIAGLVRTEISLKKTTQRIFHLPVITDESKIWIMSLLDNLVTYAYQNDPALLPLAILKGHRYTIRYGLSEYAPAILSLVGLLLVGALGDFVGARAYVEHALTLSENHRGVQARVMFVAYQFVMHWQIPTEMCKKPLLQGYTVGIKTGDTESACWAIYCYLEMTIHTAGSLDSFLTECQAYGRQMQEVKQYKILMFLKMWWQVAMNLSSASSVGHVLAGNIFSVDELMQQIEETKDVHLKQQFDRVKMYSSFWFGVDAAVVKTMLQSGTDNWSFEKKNPSMFGLCPMYFHCALSCIAMARTTGQKKYKRIAMKFTKKIKGWVKKGNVNVIHYESLIDAELAALAGDTHVATKHYEVAILLAGQRGFTNDRALAHERFGEYALLSGDASDAVYHLDRALQLYQDWGAHAKVSLLKLKHSDLLQPPKEIKVSPGSEDASMLSLGGPSDQFEMIKEADVSTSESIATNKRFK